MKEQKNAMTQNVYQGKNQEILMNEKEDQNYKSDEWMTFCQARMEGLKLVNAKGKGVRIYKAMDKLKAEKRKGDKKGSFFAGFATVFNKDLTMEM